jgi:hypothetical protein
MTPPPVVVLLVPLELPAEALPLELPDEVLPPEPLAEAMPVEAPPPALPDEAPPPRAPEPPDPPAETLPPEELSPEELPMSGLPVPLGREPPLQAPSVAVRMRAAPSENASRFVRVCRIICGAPGWLAKRACQETD